MKNMGDQKHYFFTKDGKMLKCYSWVGDEPAFSIQKIGFGERMGMWVDDA